MPAVPEEAAETGCTGGSNEKGVQNEKMNTAEVLVKCLENEGVEYIFGIPGEENLDVMNALKDSSVRIPSMKW